MPGRSRSRQEPRAAPKEALKFFFVSITDPWNCSRLMPSRTNNETGRSSTSGYVAPVLVTRHDSSAPRVATRKWRVASGELLAKEADRVVWFGFSYLLAT